MVKDNSSWATYNYSGENRKARKTSLKIIFWTLILFLLSGIAYGSFFAYKLYSLEKKINPAESADTTFLKTAQSLVTRPAIDLKGMENDRINILLLGIAGKGKPGQNLTDTIMIASVDLASNRIALLSIPRDFYVKLPELGLQNKINTVYQNGISNYKDNDKAAELVAKTVKNITALDINYYVIMNFDGFQKIIDSIGGINIMNERDIYDTRYPGPNYSYETFSLAKGFHRLDGATTLKYVRERHGDPEGDFGRAKRQQQVLQAMKNKIFSTGSLLNVVSLNNLFDALGETIQTDIRAEEIGSFMELSKKLDTQNINNLVLDAWNKDSLLKVTHIFFGGVRAFALQPRVGNYSEIKEVAENIFDLNAIRRRRETIAVEDASIAILNQSGDPALTGKIKKVLGDNLNYRNVAMLNNPAGRLAEKTIAYDLTDGMNPFTLDELVEKLPASPSYGALTFLDNLAGGKKFDIVVSLGKDLVDIYNVEEGTVEDLNKERDEQEDAYLQKK